MLCAPSADERKKKVGQGEEVRHGKQKARKDRRRAGGACGHKESHVCVHMAKAVRDVDRRFVLTSAPLHTGPKRRGVREEEEAEQRRSETLVCVCVVVLRVYQPFSKDRGEK